MSLALVIAVFAAVPGTTAVAGTVTTCGSGRIAMGCGPAVHHPSRDRSRVDGAGCCCTAGTMLHVVRTRLGASRRSGGLATAWDVAGAGNLALQVNAVRHRQHAVYNVGARHQR